jgi:hypothetical protein
VGGETGSSTSSSPQTTFSDILTVTSLEEVTRHFGEPTSTEYDRFPEGSPTDHVVTLDHDGISLEYRKGGGEIKLQTMVITSTDRFLKVGGVRLQPGMSTDSLSAVMRKTVRDDGEGFFRVAPPGKREHPRSIRDSETTIQFWVGASVWSPTPRRSFRHRLPSGPAAVFRVGGRCSHLSLGHALLLQGAFNRSMPTSQYRSCWNGRPQLRRRRGLR